MREFLKGLELDKETIDSIMAEHGKHLTGLKEQVESYKTEVESYKTEIDELKESSKASEELQKKYDELVNESKDKDAKITTSARERAILRAGITDDDEIEFISYKVGKMEGDFDENLTEFLTNNTKFGTSKNSAPTKATGAEPKTPSVPQESGVTAILKSKHPELFN
jgi:chromosome segregation ATPase